MFDRSLAYRAGHPHLDFVSMLSSMLGLVMLDLNLVDRLGPVKLCL